MISFATKNEGKGRERGVIGGIEEIFWNIDIIGGSLSTNPTFLGTKSLEATGELTASYYKE